MVIGTKERKDREKLVRRNEIIDAAERIIFSKGYHSATMDDISKEAEFSKRTVYVYFNSKEQIYFEIMARGYKLLDQMLSPHTTTSGESALQRLRQIASTLYEYSNEYPAYFDAIMEYENGEMDFDQSIPEESREECYRLGERILGYLTGILQDGMRQGVIRADIDPVNTALVLWACVLGVFRTAKKKHRYIKIYHQADPEQLVSGAFDLLIRSIER
ncbi:TetR/AcrR family transcriptional regulator [Paenibacillus tuaregi]|uniref:TetR/AcrR family transcriptional regulator n=1 Tax=Paenibacillus tuaregi TaxID=1816681 RepID=UPI000A68F117|nr:TetR/AcrR family transcriptional regulator [Paenibacillus tuaregi]